MTKINRRNIQIVLGCLWFLDGALQLQHQMFTSAFATQVINPAVQGQATWISGPANFWVHMFLTHPAIFNSLIALTQLGLGVLILWRRTAKWGLVASVFWGLFVWSIGEGYGGLFTGQALLLSGAPGAALLYSIIGIGVLPTKSDNDRPADWLVYIWLTVWVGGTALMLQSAATSQNLSAMLASMAQGAPGWLGSLDLHAASLLISAGWILVPILILQIFAGLAAILSRRWRISGIWVGVVLSLIFWVVGQSLCG